MNTQISSTKTFCRLAQNHALWNHPFLQHCQADGLTLLEVQILAVQMYKFSKEFNRILASILSQCADERAQWVILDNLFDEMGRGDLNQAHPALFRQFTQALGISDTVLEAIPAEPETSAMIETYLSFANQYGYLSALGAVCFASEGIVNTLYSQLYRGIQGLESLSKESLVFFEVHINVDDSHAAKLSQLIETRLHTHDQVTEMKKAILAAMDARANFFDGIQRQVTESSGYQIAALELTCA